MDERVSKNMKRAIEEELPIAPADENIYPLLPLRDVVIFPGMVIPLYVGRAKSIASLEAAMQGAKQAVLVAQKEPETEDPNESELYPVGTLCQLLQMLKLPDGSTKVLVEGLKRVDFKQMVIFEPILLAEVDSHPERSEQNTRVNALVRYLRDKFESYVKLNRKVPQETLLSISKIEDPAQLADQIASWLTVPVAEKQRLLASRRLSARLTHLSKLLEHELEILELETRIKGEVRKQMDQSQKEYYVQEQIKLLQRELGKDNDGNDEFVKYQRRIDQSAMSQEAREKAYEELDRLKLTSPMSPEATVMRNYLDWLCDLPWGESTHDRIDLDKAGTILNKDHYGLAKPKERILEFLAVRKLKQSMKGPILCFAGPPGVGKTSLGRSIARAMGRNFVKLSLGGLRDEAEIRGHRRTYIGSMPGRIIQSIKKAGSNNPVFLLDEIDKMSMDFRGDPASALLEVLDPEQNHTFSDHYIEVEFDLSRVMFIVTANVLHTIPPALHDRLEIIELPSYTEEEKIEIAKGFLWPKQVDEHGLKPHKPRITPQSLSSIVRNYTREAGVRNLDRELANICRKLARQLAVEENPKRISIRPKKVHELLGVPRYRETDYARENGVGTATGLAVTRVGGETLTIEVSLMQGNGQLILTGQMGEVMQESAKAALSYARARSRSLGLDPEFHKRFDIHVHIPEGAIPKDGPSAGIALASALISALTGHPVRDSVAMTGELTLRGRVLGVGGIKEKLLAANRMGIAEVILPEDNQKDMPDVPQVVKDELTIHFVEDMQTVIQLTFHPHSSPAKQ